MTLSSMSYNFLIFLTTGTIQGICFFICLIDSTSGLCLLPFVSGIPMDPSLFIFENSLRNCINRSIIVCMLFNVLYVRLSFGMLDKILSKMSSVWLSILYFRSDSSTST